MSHCRKSGKLSNDRWNRLDMAELRSGKEKSGKPARDAGGGSFCCDGEVCQESAVVDYVRFSFSQLCRYTVSLPLIGLIVCFVSANIFQQNDIHETYCRVSTNSANAE